MGASNPICPKVGGYLPCSRKNEKAGMTESGGTRRAVLGNEVRETVGWGRREIK